MKQIKKIVIAMIVIVLSFSMFSCGDKETDLNGIIKIVIAEENPIVYEVELSKVAITNGAVSVLEYLKETKGLDFVTTSGDYGAMITKIGNLEQDISSSKYIYIYTSVKEDFDVSIYAQTISYLDYSLTSAGVGISEMTLQDGCIIYFDTITY